MAWGGGGRSLPRRPERPSSEPTAAEIRLAKPMGTAGVGAARNPACAVRPELAVSAFRRGWSASRGGWDPPESVPRGIRLAPSARNRGYPPFGADGPLREADGGRRNLRLAES